MKRVKFMMVLCASLLVVCFMAGIVNAQDLTDDSWIDDTNGVTTDDNATIRPTENDGTLQVGPSAFIEANLIPGLAQTASFSNYDNEASLLLMNNQFLFLGEYGNYLTIEPGATQETNINSGVNDLNITSDGVICIGDCD